jgi:tRNA pseudouridine38-40 synthase
MTTLRLRLDAAYDGTAFSGWAVQPDRRTVAGVVTAALERLFGPGGAAGLTVAGRTDAGVHATGQVCHVEVPAARYQVLAGSLVRRLAGLLPPDVRVTAAGVAPAGFDARFSALWRRYTYRVTDHPAGSDPLRRVDTLAWPRQLDIDRLAAASTGLLGEHDFAAFCRRRPFATTVRAIQRLDWSRERDGVLVATVQADAFCHSMVRSLVGALLVAGDGRREVDWPAGLLTRTARADEVVVASPHGLTLVAVGYPDDPADLARRAELTRNRREPVPAPARDSVR